MRALRVASLLVVTLAACSVETDSLKPRSAAECAALGQKVCGNRCMPIDLENGCGQPGCVPCPAPAQGYEAYCDGGAPSACATRITCPTGSAYCEGPYDLTCDDIRTSGTNCGACGHSCGGASCNDYACTAATVLGGAVNPPVDIASDGLRYYWFLNDYMTPGNLAVFRSDMVAGTPLLLWSAHDTRLEADSGGLVLWSERAGDSIWEDPAGATSALNLFTPSSGVRALALDPGYMYFAEYGAASTGETSTDLLEVGRAGNRLPPGQFYGHSFAGDQALTAVALEQPLTSQSNVVVGTETGALRWLSYDLASNGTYATGIETPAALAAYHGQFGGVTTPRTILFWVGASGNVHGKILPGGPIVNLTGWAIPSTGAVDIFADGDGVYWVDSGFQGANAGGSGTWGLVGEWRASYDDVVLLHLSAGARPTRVTATGSRVAWLDATTGAVLDVHK